MTNLHILLLPNQKSLHKMTMTIELLAQRVAVLEKQMATLLAHQSTPVKEKKQTKAKKDSSDEDKPKTKRTSGYILFSQASRNEVKAKLTTDNEEKVKSTAIMQELGKMWKALSDEERGPWNEKANAIKEPVVDAE